MSKKVPLYQEDFFSLGEIKTICYIVMDMLRCKSLLEGKSLLQMA
jgi:hypothetical protein